MTPNEAGLALSSALVGAVLILAILALAGRAPTQTQKEGYRQGVKDCMAGRAKVEIKADTLVTFP